MLFRSAVISGTAVPALVATAWIFGCCALPFHLCRLSAMHDAAPQQQPVSAPAAKMRHPTVRAVVPAAQTCRLAPADRERLRPFSAAAYRNFLTLGAMRCDRDVGLHTLLATFII